MKTKYKSHEILDGFIFANAQMASGVHDGALTKFASTSNLPPYRLVCFAEDSDHVRLCQANEMPIGAVHQTSQDPLCVYLLGSCKQTVQLKASDVVKAGTLLCADADGCIKSLPTTAGKYTCVGLALTSGAKDDLIEVASTVAHQLEIKE